MIYLYLAFNKQLQCIEVVILSCWNSWIIIVTFKIFSSSLYTLYTMRFVRLEKKNLLSAWRYAIHVVGIKSHQLVFSCVSFPVQLALGQLCFLSLVPH